MKVAPLVSLAVVAAVGIVPATVARASDTRRVVVIVLENKTYDRIVGNRQAPYLNGLLTQGEQFTDYAAVGAGSPHDYRAMTSGLTTGGSGGPNLFRAMDATGIDWREFSESMTGTCGEGSDGKVPGSKEPLYTKNHDPAWMYRSTESCKQRDVPMAGDTFDPADLPRFSLVIPNQCDDMHSAPSGGLCPAWFGDARGGSSIAVGDDWLKTVVPQLLAQPDVTVLVTFDEGSNASHQHVLMVEVGSGVTAGSKDGGSYDHYGLLAGLYARFGLGTPPNHAANATPLPIP